MDAAVARNLSRIAALLAACAAPPLALAQGQGDAPAEKLNLSIEVDIASLPRLDAESAPSAPRIGFAVLPAGPTAMGLAVGISPQQAGQAGTPGVDLGLHFRHVMDNRQQLDVTAWRRVGADDAIALIQQKQPVYGARVEMKLTPVRRAGLALDSGFIGLQLESGARITVRRKDGKPMVYYRSRF